MVIMKLRALTETVHQCSANDQASSAIISENVKCPHKINLYRVDDKIHLQFQSQVPSDPPID